MKLKRGIALLLCVCMIFGILPAVHAEDLQEEQETVVLEEVPDSSEEAEEEAEEHGEVAKEEKSDADAQTEVEGDEAPEEAAEDEQDDSESQLLMVEEEPDEGYYDWMENIPIESSDRYTGNQGDSFISAIGTRNGKKDIYGTTFEHGLEVWIARWNFTEELSWAWTTYRLNGMYKVLSGTLSILAGSYNKADFDTTLEIIGDDVILFSANLTPNMEPIPIHLDLSGIEVLKISAYDNRKVRGGTSFALGDLRLAQDETFEPPVDREDDLQSDEIWLDEIPIESHSKGVLWNMDSKISALEQKAEDVNGISYIHGVEAFLNRTPSMLKSEGSVWATYNLGGKYKTLSGTISILSKSENKSDFEITLKILGDNDVILFSTILTPETTIIPVEVDVSKVVSLTLSVYDNYSAYKPTSVLFGNCKLTNDKNVFLEDITSIHLLAFSNLAYKNWELGDTVYAKLKDDWNRDAFQKDENPKVTNEMLYSEIRDWKVVGISTMCKDIKSNGFYAVAFQGETKKGTQTVLAFRGSTGIDKILTVDGASDWIWNDIPFQAYHTYTNQLDDAQLFYKKCINQQNIKNTNIVATGHSLGGGLASVVSMCFGVKAEIFNSASAYEALYKNKPEIVGKTFLGVDKWDIISHVIKNDPVSNWFNEYTYMPYRLYQRDGNSFFHLLDCFLSIDTNGKLRMAELINESNNPEAFRNVPGSNLFLGTSYGERAIQKFDNGRKVNMYGGEGDDELVSTGWNDDILVGGKCNYINELDGGLGNDNYYYFKGDGQLRINDAGGIDTLYLNGFDATDKIDVHRVDNNVVLAINGTGLILISMNRSKLGRMKAVLNSSIEIDLDGFTWKKISKSLSVQCPTDIEIIDADGNVVLVLKNGEETTLRTDFGNFYVFTDENGESVKYFDMVEGFDFRIVGTDNGNMDVAFCIDEGEIYYSFEVPVEAGMTAVIDETDQPILMIDYDSDGVVDSTVPMKTETDTPTCSEHKWDDGEILVQSTHTEQGTIQYRCTVCGQTMKEKIECLTEHTFSKNVVEVKYLKTEASCTTPATYYKSCVCGEAGTETFTSGNPLSHTEVIDKAVEATCTEAGKNEGKHCSVCGTVIVAQETVNAKGHTEVIDKAVDATCTVPGKTEGKHCSVCNVVLVKQEVVPAAHKIEIVAAVAPTCTESGLTAGGICVVCSYESKGEEIAPLGHTEVTDKAVEADCTTPGKTEGKHCSVCGTVIVAQETVQAKGHTSSAWEQDENSHWQICERCGEEIEGTRRAHLDENGDKLCDICGRSVAAEHKHSFHWNGYNKDKNGHTVRCDCGESHVEAHSRNLAGRCKVCGYAVGGVAKAAETITNAVSTLIRKIINPLGR